MHKTHHLGNALFAAAVGVALAVLPTNSEANSMQSSLPEELVNAGGGELVHGVIVVGIVATVVTFSRILGKKSHR